MSVLTPVSCAVRLALTTLSGGEELPRAYIVKAPGQDITPEAVVKYMDAKVSRHKRLTGGVRIVDVIMKNPVSTRFKGTLDRR